MSSSSEAAASPGTRWPRLMCIRGKLAGAEQLQGDAALTAYMPSDSTNLLLLFLSRCCSFNLYSLWRGHPLSYACHEFLVLVQFVYIQKGGWGRVSLEQIICIYALLFATAITQPPFYQRLSNKIGE